MPSRFSSVVTIEFVVLVILFDSIILLPTALFVKIDEFMTMPRPEIHGKRLGDGQERLVGTHFQLGYYYDEHVLIVNSPSVGW
jgi:hypothetical protein